MHMRRVGCEFHHTDADEFRLSDPELGMRRRSKLVPQHISSGDEVGIEGHSAAMIPQRAKARRRISLVSILPWMYSCASAIHSELGMDPSIALE